LSMLVLAVQESDAELSNPSAVAKEAREAKEARAKEAREAREVRKAKAVN